MTDAYQTTTKLSKNSWVTDPEVQDPDNLPIPLGYTLLVRPYPINETTKSGLILAGDSIDYMNYVTNVARVVSIGPCCWNRADHRNKNGERFDWVQVGDFVSFPKNVGARRKFKGVSYVLLTDDDITELLPDPHVMAQQGAHSLNIPDSHMKKYNTYMKEEV